MDLEPHSSTIQQTLSQKEYNSKDWFTRAHWAKRDFCEENSLRLNSMTVSHTFIVHKVYLLEKYGAQKGLLPIGPQNG